MRYLKVYWKASIWLHRISGIIIWGSTVTMAFITIAKDEWEIKKGLHPAIGLAVFIAVTLPSIGGIFARYQLESARWKTSLILKMKIGHKLFAALVIVLAQIAILLGGLAYSERVGKNLAKNLVIAAFVAFFGILIILEIFYRLYLRKETPFSDNANTISEEEF